MPINRWYSTDFVFPEGLLEKKWFVEKLTDDDCVKMMKMLNPMKDVMDVKLFSLMFNKLNVSHGRAVFQGNQWQIDHFI